MTKNSLVAIIIIGCGILGSLKCPAKQESSTNAAKSSAPAAATTTKKPRVVKVRFDDELVKGSTEKPDVSNMDVKKNFNYKKLIRVRENFMNEMENGLDDFKGK